jgi:hypothetical protein
MHLIIEGVEPIWTVQRDLHPAVMVLGKDRVGHAGLQWGIYK